MSQRGLTPTSSRQEIPSWVTVLASPCPASLGHLIFHQLRLAEGTLEADLLMADPIPGTVPVRWGSTQDLPLESLRQAVPGRSLRQDPKSTSLVFSALTLVG